MMNWGPIGTHRRGHSAGGGGAAVGAGPVIATAGLNSGGRNRGSPGRPSPGPSGLCNIGVSTQRPSLKPTDRKVPMSLKPKRRCSAIEPGIGAVADDREHLAPRSSPASVNRFPEQRGAYALARRPSAT